ncbi:hypothetical protein INS49_002574 [Diaporthe citri]|uniref:uncharacterized protein n=1 Tax=Diaporthe citri TaxID=83186 RepID=UPI001C7E4F6B|nr:uncharacterized protein INS49_002574 [Diaporthe citri]KAG6368369.1 hypothetical protein INS49_002574 [Diaporthe citri]
MQKADADIDAPTSQEQVIDDGPESPADDHINVGETEDDTGNEGVSALHEFLKGMKADDEDASGEVKRLREMLRESRKAYVNTKGPGGVASLHLAAERGLEKAAKVLIEAKANISIQDENSWQPLHYACREGKRNIAELLIENGAEINAQDRCKETPLHKACKPGYTDLVDLLLKSDAKMDIPDEDGMMPLYYTARWGQGPTMEALLHKDKSNIDYVVQEDNGWTALHVAAYYGHDEIVAILHEAQAKQDIRDDEGCTPLLLATTNGHVGVMRKLLSEPENGGSQLEAQNNNGDKPLLLAAAYDFSAGVHLLIEHDVDCNSRNKASMTPIIVASRWRNLKVVLALLQHEKRTEINAQDERKQTALHKAASGGHAKVLELLLDNDADVSIPDDRGRRALHLACFQGNVAIVKLLLDHAGGQQLEAHDQDGMTPLHIACKASDEDVEHTSLDDLGPDYLTERERSMPEFSFGRHSAVVELLLSRGADLNAKTNTEETVLRLAIQSGEHEKVRHLVKYMKVNDEEAPLCSTLNTSDSGQTNKDFYALLTWAAGVFEMHSVAKSLIRKRFTSSTLVPPKYESAIEWAAWAELPEVLWLLIANSPWDKKTVATIKSLETPKTPVSQSQQKGGEQDQNCDDADPHMEDRFTVQDVIRDPPLGLLRNMHADSQDFGPPTVEDESYSNTLRQSEAAVFQFYKGKSRFGSIRRYRNVEEVIYTKGPQTITEAMMKKVKLHIEDLEPSFTWVHLPSTNMVWMNDLLQAIMKKEGYNAGQFRQVKAFLKASWVQVPDKTSESRIMRPRFAIKDHVPEADDETNQIGTELQSSKAKKGEVRKEEKGKDERFTKRKDTLFAKERERRDGTRDEMNQEDGIQAAKSTAASAIYIIHRSPTLDEWYYHFDLSDLESTKDKDQRNESQVVHKYLPKDDKKQTHWPLIRVNQLWIWTLGNIVDYCIESYERRPESPKGLLSIRQMFSKAINVIGRGETMLFKDFSSLIQRWREQIEGKVGQGKRSKQGKDGMLQDNHSVESDHAGVFPGETDNDDKGGGEISADDELRKATKTAQDLSNDIKDIRDELNILKATAQYQQDVQEALYVSQERVRISQEGVPSASQKGSLMERIQRLQANLSATHVVNDIREMDSVADRIQAAVT